MQRQRLPRHLQEYPVSTFPHLAMMVLHNLLKAVRKRNRILNYHAYSPEFYARAYSVSTFPRFSNLVPRDPAPALPAAVLPRGSAGFHDLDALFLPASVHVVAQLARGSGRHTGPGFGFGFGPSAVRHAEPQQLLLQPEPVDHLLAGNRFGSALRGHHRFHHPPQGVPHPLQSHPRGMDRHPRPRPVPRECTGIYEDSRGRNDF